MFEVGELACAVATTRQGGEQQPDMAKHQRKLLSLLDRGVPVMAGSEYLSKRLDGLKLPAELHILRPVQIGGGEEAALWFFPRMYLHCWFKADTHVNLLSDLSNPCAVPISQHTTLQHLMDALGHLVLNSLALPRTPSNENTENNAESCNLCWRISEFEFKQQERSVRRATLQNEGQLVFKLLSLTEESISSTAIAANPEDKPGTIDVFFTITTSLVNVAPTETSNSEVSATFDPPQITTQIKTPSLPESPYSTVDDGSTAVSLKTSIYLPPSKAHPIPRYPHGLVGLNNMGNSCYMNSALQCLFQTSPLVSYFLQLSNDSVESLVTQVIEKLNSDSSVKPAGLPLLDEYAMKYCVELNQNNVLGSNHCAVAKSFGMTLKKVWLKRVQMQRVILLNDIKSSNNSSSTLNMGHEGTDDMVGPLLGSARSRTSSTEPKLFRFGPRSLKGHLGQFNESFKGFAQQDSQEFIQVLLDALHEDLKRPVSINTSISTDSPSSHPSEPTSTTSPIAQIFQGNLRSNIECTICQFTSTKIDPFTLLSVPISNGVDGPCKPPPQIAHLICSSIRTTAFTCHQIAVESDWSILDLKRTLAARLNYSEATRENLKSLVIVYSVRDGTIRRLFEDYEPASEVVQLQDCNEYFSPTMDGVVVAELQKLADVPSTNFPLSFVIDTFLMGIPVWPTIPSSIELRYLVPDLYAHLEKKDKLLLKRTLIHSRLGEIVYNSTVRHLSESGLSRFPLYCPEKCMKGGKWMRRVIQQLNKSEADDRLSDLRESCVDRPAEGFKPIPSLFKVSLWKGRSRNEDGSSIRLQEKRYFLQRGHKEVDEHVIYPASPLPEVFVHPENTELMDRMSELYELDESHRQNGFSVDIKHAMESARSGKSSVLIDFGRYSFEGEIMVEISFEPEIASLLFGEEYDVESPFEFMPKYDNLMVQTDFPLGEETPGSPKLEHASAITASYTLDNCLQEFLKEELMSTEDLWFCTKCNDHKQIKKKLDIAEAPEVLIFHLKRFAASGGGSFNSSRKIEVPVEFPVIGLDMSNYINSNTANLALNSSNSAEGKSLLYDLYAVSNHFGGLGGGHYTAYVQSLEDGHWYNMDDNRVTRLFEDDIVTSAAYILFYKRRSLDVLREAEHKAFWETWEKLVTFEESLDAAQMATETTEQVKTELDYLSVHESGKKSRTASENASFETAQFPTESLNKLHQANQFHLDASVCSKRAKTLSGSDDITSLPSTRQSGIGSPAETDPNMDCKSGHELAVEEVIHALVIDQATSNAEDIVFEIT